MKKQNISLNRHQEDMGHRKGGILHQVNSRLHDSLVILESFHSPAIFAKYCFFELAYIPFFTKFSIVGGGY